MAKAARIMGVDIGGTGVKAAVVDVEKGTLVTERLRVKTPDPSTPQAVIETIAGLQQQLAWKGPIGCGFPGLVKGGVVHRAPNLDASWSGHHLVDDLKARLGTDLVVVGNDADVAGLAEMRFGAGRGVRGNVLVVTLGTGIGSALFHDGVLVPDTELGHAEIDGKDAERSASNTAREEHGWKWKKWGRRVAKYLKSLQYLLAVDLFILGGGVSKDFDRFGDQLTDVGCDVVPAQLENQAGVVGAALLVERAELEKPTPRKPVPSNAPRPAAKRKR